MGAVTITCGSDAETIFISASTPKAASSIPVPETGILGWVLPGLILQLKGEPGTAWPLNLKVKLKKNLESFKITLKLFQHHYIFCMLINRL